MEKFILKLGYYSIYEVIEEDKIRYKVDSGALLYLAKFNKTIENPYRDIKFFDNVEKAKTYVTNILEKQKKKKNVKVRKLKKSLYLILMKEESSGKIFVKVGITTKKFIARRFSKEYGYEGYTIEKILRRVETPKAAKFEKEIKDKLNKKRSIKKYRPLLESFSGYSECYDYLGLDEIIRTFDSVANS